MKAPPQQWRIIGRATQAYTSLTEMCTGTKRVQLVRESNLHAVDSWTGSAEAPENKQRGPRRISAPVEYSKGCGIPVPEVLSSHGKLR